MPDVSAGRWRVIRALASADAAEHSSEVLVPGHTLTGSSFPGAPHPCHPLGIVGLGVAEGVEGDTVVSMAFGFAELSLRNERAR